ncbi:MAG: hypothetical protein K2J65_00340 [Duncaniella sp.]|nr:hypothetical protein [Duncaniella sp.]
MADFPYIHIALRGEVQGSTRTLYSYPTGSDHNPAWDTKMVEPAAAIRRFLNATDCYVIQSDPTGHYFSLITCDTINPQRGYMMISILVDNGCALTGKQLMGIFNNLKRTFIEDNNLSDEAVDTALHQASVPVEPLRLESWDYRAPAENETVGEAAYRTYISIQELESIFSFPAQPDYAGYRCIIVVSASSSLRPGVKMPRITSQVKKLYTVVCPPDVIASPSQIYDGDRLTLTYTKEGFIPHTETVIAGTPSAYVKNDGSTLLVRTSEQTGIRFIRRVGLKVTSSKGTDINGFTVSVNGRSINTMVPYIEFTARDLTPGEQIEIQVASNNYHPLKLKKPTEELLTTEQLDLKLNPVEQGITLRLDFGDGRIFEQQISIEKNTSEYNRLHSGNFHGFRAHRQVTQDGSEVYNVDVRITSRPVAPNFETAESHESQQQPTHKAPVFEKVADDKTLTAAQSNEPPTTIYDANDEDETETEEYRPWFKKIWLWLIICLFVAAIGASLIFMDWNGDSTGETEPQQETAEVTGNTAQTPVAATPEEQADIDYLNSYPVWEVDKLQSDMGKQLIAAITAGDIDAIVNNPYFAVTGRCTNDKANLVAELIWRAKGSYSESSNRRILRSAVKNGSITLYELSDNLAKRRPAEKENQTPRPGSGSVPNNQ